MKPFGINVMPVPMSIADCGEGQLSPDEIKGLVELKVRSMKELLQQGFVPCKSHPDGRMVLRNTRDESPQFIQLHAWKDEEKKWGMSVYPTETSEGEPMLTFAQQMERVAGDSKFRLIKEAFPVAGHAEGEGSEEDEDDGCDCRGCHMRRQIRFLLDNEEHDKLDQLCAFIDDLVASVPFDPEPEEAEPEDDTPRVLH